MSDYEFEELEEITADLSNYYSEITGRNIEIGIDEDEDLWISSSRTNGREYLESLKEVERRLHLLYGDLIEDNEDEEDTPW